jgi:putative ABC transport system substrate-binding protein
MLLSRHTRRRQFISLLGGAAAWPLAARGQQPATPVIGFLRTTSLADSAHLAAAFRQGLKETGFLEGQDVAIEYHFAENQPSRLPTLVADLISRQVSMLVASGGDVAPRAAKVATSTIPILFAMGGDPVAAGLVASLSRPGGNVTGVVFFSGALGMKRLELLRELLPAATTIGLLVTPNSPETETERRDIEAAAQATGCQLVILDASSEHDIETAFATFVQRGAGALLVGSGPFFNSNRERIVALATRRALPASYSLREYAVAGGLMAYGASITDAYRQLGIYAGKILKGNKPADLPVMRATKFELVINLKTAKALGLEIPPTLLARADEVIE